MWSLKDGLWQDNEFPVYHFVTSRDLGDARDPIVRSRILSSQRIDEKSIIKAQQIHGNNIKVVGHNDRYTEILGVDGLITKEKDISLIILTADCLPVFIVDINLTVVALLHAGWRGISSGIVKSCSTILMKNFNITPDMLYVSIGPHIQECCYTVGEDLKKIFGLDEDNERLSLSFYIINQLKEIGIKRISYSKDCTCHNPELFFSFRRDKTRKRMMSLIRLQRR